MLLKLSMQSGPRTAGRFGVRGVPAVGRLPGTGPHLMQTLDVQIDSDSEAQFQELLRRVEDARGVLHPDVADLKR
jgi:hypothetical protein